jgi:hypothetical protein
MDNQLNQPKNNNIAFVLGNGKSRLNADLNVLKNYGTIYGCNALYREFEPDHLVAVDVKMINEIIASGYHKTHSVWTNPNKGVSTKTNVNFFSPHKGWSSGPTALWMAAQKGYKKIYILGFDYQGFGGKFNNVYADTFNYKKSTDAATFHGNWLSQTDKVVREYKNIKFYRVVEDSSAFIPDLLSTNNQNLQHIGYKEFLAIFTANIYSEQINQKTTI